MKEKWRPVPGYECFYLVSNLGRIFSKRKKKMLSPFLKGDGKYMRISLTKDGKARIFGVHQVVAKAFVPGEAPGLDVCHNDGNGLNNRFDNLRWDTRSANILDSVEHGTHSKASKSYCPAGHSYSSENTYIIPSSGGRVCRTCQRERNRIMKPILAARKKARTNGFRV